MKRSVARQTVGTKENLAVIIDFRTVQTRNIVDIAPIQNGIDEFVPHLFRHSDGVKQRSQQLVGRCIDINKTTVRFKANPSFPRIERENICIVFFPYRRVGENARGL